MWRFVKYFNFHVHLMVAGAIRILLICYSIYHDQHFLVPYTDVDYKVFTDAARYVADNKSPYDRHTYRYSPLIAFMLVPNIWLHPCFGKLLFCIVDLIVGALIRAIVMKTIRKYEEYENTKESNVLNTPSLKNVRNRSRRVKHKRFLQFYNKHKTYAQQWADFSAILWLYNPLTIAIATRGNADSIAGLFVLLTLYLLQCKRKYFAAGLIHGVSVHLRLYPIIYSLAMFAYLSAWTMNRKKKNEKDSLKMMLMPNFDQMRLISGCLLSLTLATAFFYYLYGYTFLFETYFYHLQRQDTRHNFSLFFYLQYLTAGVQNIGLWQTVLMKLPLIVLLYAFSLRYGFNKFALNFAVLMLTITMVTYNTVVTSQYFVWILVVLPLSVWQIKMSLKTSVFLATIWCAAQAAWLLPAYFLEFHAQNTFLFIWIQSVALFCANIAILGRLINNYMPPTKIKTH